MNYRWIQKPEPPAPQTLKLHQALGIDPILCKLLAQRGILDFASAKSYFRPKLADLHPPFLMKDMTEAVARIVKAMEANERILIYGDYDVDGTTSVSLFYSFLNRHYELLDTYIPDRYKEGYGISYAGIDYAVDNGISLIIALDCGIKAHKQVAYAKEQGVEFIICDHHQPGDSLPEAVAVLDPKRKDCLYPYKELSGCGVGFKLVQALCAQWNLGQEEWFPLLDLLAISIGADIVPITGENRVLAFYGLEVINKHTRKSISFLRKAAGRELTTMNITDVVFLIAPRINAAGRISHGQLAVNLLISEDEEELERLAAIINDHNTERRSLDADITQKALKMIETEKLLHSTVVFDPDWHKGVIGIVASRLIEKHYRPTVVFTESQGVLAGSARSVNGFNIYDALSACDDILEQFGGHKYAAGMTLKPEKYQDFKDKFDAVVGQSIQHDQLEPFLEIDTPIGFAECTDRFYKILKQFSPFGPQNLAPLFQTDQLVDKGCKLVGEDKSHLKVRLLEPSSGKVMDGIGFSMGDKLDCIKSGKPISVVYHLEENHFRGNTRLQLMIKDIKLSGEVDTN